jgi:hypothetical protein
MIVYYVNVNSIMSYGFVFWESSTYSKKKFKTQKKEK